MLPGRHGVPSTPCRPRSHAARRAGVETVILPKGNEKDLQELAPEVRRGLRFVPVETMDEVLDLALASPLGQNARQREEGGALYAH